MASRPSPPAQSTSEHLGPAIVNILYRKLLQHDITSHALTTNDISSDGRADGPWTRTAPGACPETCFSGPTSTSRVRIPRLDFWGHLDKVGVMHVGLGRAHPLHIEYIHLGVCLGFIQHVLTEAILRHPGLHMQRRVAPVKALGKVIWIQNDFMAKWHVRGATEFGLIAGDKGDGRVGVLGMARRSSMIS